MANKFWNDHNLETQRKAWHWFLAIALGVFLGIYAANCGQDNAPELLAQDGGEHVTGRAASSLGHTIPSPVGTASPSELHFYQLNPPCKDALTGYILLSGPLYTEEHHRVYICGYHR